MNVIPDMRYLGPEERKRLYRLGGMIGAMLIIGIAVLLTKCHGGAPSTNPVTHMQGDDQKTLAQIQEAMFGVSAALADDPPAATVLEAVRRVQAGKGDDLTKSVVDGSLFKFNPNKAQWTAGRAGSGVATVLVVGPPPASYKARNVALIGMAMGGIPVEIAKGQEPEWLPNAVTP